MSRSLHAVRKLMTWRGKQETNYLQQDTAHGATAQHARQLQGAHAPLQGNVLRDVEGQKCAGRADTSLSKYEFTSAPSSMADENCFMFPAPTVSLEEG
eukprot:66683-Hanusia_phi.AAC.1